MFDSLLRAGALELTILMPCLNEARTLPSCVSKARAFLERAGVKGEVLVADNGSEDGSPLIARKAGARIVTVSEKGYGAALAGGVLAARGRFVIMGDADDSYDFLALDPILEALRGGAQLVVGNRFRGGIRKGAMPFLNRYVGNPVLSFIGRLFFKVPLGDFHCGLRGFEREAVLDLDLRTTGMEYASEMIVRASLCGLSVAEVPVTLAPDGRARASHLKPWRDGWRHLRFLLLYSPRWLYLYPGLAMIVTGLAISGLLMPGPVMISQDVGLDVHTLLLACLSILVGMQTLTFGVLARTYAERNGMLGRSARYDRLLSHIKLEPMLAVAAVMLACGLGGVGWAVSQWSAADFGALDYRNAMRALLLALTCIVGGIQLAFSAFLLGVMGIRHK